MAYEVRGEDGRLLHRQLNDQDAHSLAYRVTVETGETVTLIPWRLSEGEWATDEDMAEKVGGAAKAEKKPKKDS